MNLILNKAQAIAVRGAMCALNNVGGLVSATFDTFYVQERECGRGIMIGNGRHQEWYADQNEFFTAYGIDAFAASRSAPGMSAVSICCLVPGMALSSAVRHPITYLSRGALAEWEEGRVSMALLAIEEAANAAGYADDDMLTAISNANQFLWMRREKDRLLPLYLLARAG